MVSMQHRLATLRAAPATRTMHGIGQRGRLKRSARAVQLFGRLAVLETHALRY